MAKGLPHEALLNAFSCGVENVLPNNLVGLYLYGSITSSEYSLTKSDIDFLALIHKPLTVAEEQALANLHRELCRLFSDGKRLEGGYVLLDDMGKTGHDLPPYPFVVKGQFQRYGHYDVNHVTWWQLKHTACILKGQDIRHAILTEWNDVIETMRYNLDIYWQDKQGRPDFFKEPEDVEFTVLTLCRIWNTLKNREILPKMASARKMMSDIDTHWHPLIAHVLDSRSGRVRMEVSDDLKKETQHFIGYVLKECSIK